jgi:hypothetical protein
VRRCIAVSHLSSHPYRINDLLVASFEVNFLILVTVVAGACVNINAAHIVAGRTTRGLACGRVVWVRAISSRILARRNRHALGSGEAPSEVLEMGTNCD